MTTKHEGFTVNKKKRVYETLDEAKRVANRYLPSIVCIEGAVVLSDVPNLDAMSCEDLMAFHDKHMKGRKRTALFPQSVPGVSLAAEDLANYAANKATAQTLRLNGRIEGALTYEAICDRIYKDLPFWAKW